MIVAFFVAAPRRTPVLPAAALMGYVDCAEHFSVGNIALGTFLTAGTFLAYVPQIRDPYSLFLYLLYFFGAILWERSSHGVSVVSSFLNALCQALLSINGFIIQYRYFVCCETVDFAQCNRLLLPYYQIAANGVGMLIVFSLVIVFFKPAPEELSFSHSIALFALYLWASLVSAFVTVFLGLRYGMLNDQTQLFGRALGIAGGICGSLMYVPQLIQTFKTKSVGSLSIGTLAIQFPGSLAVIYYQLFVNHLQWSIWVPNVLMAIFQGWLLSMCIYYEVRARWFSGKKPDEAEALLRDAATA